MTIAARCGRRRSAYDQYDNLTKSGSITWKPGYNSANNHYTLAGTSYDSNGNVTIKPRAIWPHLKSRSR